MKDNNFSSRQSDQILELKVAQLFPKVAQLVGSQLA